jgi:hypothetical protein
MNETDLPERRPMPEALRDRIWDQIEPRLDTPDTDHRFRSLRAPLAVAASVIVVALGVVLALPALRGHNGVGTAAGGNAPDALVNECVHTAPTISDPANWRAGARLDLDATHAFLVIRDDTAAAVCVVEQGKGTGLIGDEAFTGVYGKLSAVRPFDYLTSMNYPAESIHFGIAASDVIGVSLVAPDNSTSPGIVADGTFIVRSRVGENSNEPTTNFVDATLASGRHVQEPLRN